MSQETTSSQERGWELSLRIFQGRAAQPTPSSQTSGLQECEATDPVILSHPVCRTLLKQPWELNTAKIQALHCGYSFNLLHEPEMGAVTVFLLQMTVCALGEVEGIAQGHKLMNPDSGQPLIRPLLSS